MDSLSYGQVSGRETAESWCSMTDLSNIAVLTPEKQSQQEPRGDNEEAHLASGELQQAMAQVA